MIRTGGPNAGHTVYDREGQQFKLRQLPTAAVTNPNAALAISAGSLVDLEVLENEIEQTGRSVLIDPAATILEPRHIKTEQEDPDLQWGSTCKGVGAARADRIHRTAMTWGLTTRKYGDQYATCAAGGIASLARSQLRVGGTVLIEAAQGYGLGLHTQYYPKTTSADCRAIDALADVGLSPWGLGIEPEVWVVVRPYPIRVAGDSGPLRNETTWETLGLPQEHTTVTGKVRRVGLWEPALVAQAVAANGGSRCRIWLSMADQLVPAVTGMTHFGQLTALDSTELADLEGYLGTVARCGAPVHAIGTGPVTAIVLPESGWVRP